MQESVRARLIKFHEETGVSYKHIAKNINMEKRADLLSRFKNDERNLNSKLLSILDQFLISKGY